VFGTGVFGDFGFAFMERIMATGGGSSAWAAQVAKPRDDPQRDLLRPALGDIIDLGHPLVRLTGEIDWRFLDRRFSSVCTPGNGAAAVTNPAGGGAADFGAHAQPVGCRTGRCAHASWKTRITSSSAAN
jgi:hypothetical protein